MIAASRQIAAGYRLSRSYSLLGLAAAVALAAAAPGKDYGQQGQVFPVIETDMLSVIQGKLAAAQASGKIAAMQRDLARRTAAKVARPTAVVGIVDATAPRQWLYDPSITLSQDVRDSHGILIAAAGTRVNPLDHVAMRDALVFIDGDSPAQVRWAIAHTTATNAKIVLTRGSVFELMKTEQRRMFFDQQGLLTAKLGIGHVPAVVVQQGRALRITEVVVSPSGRAG